MHTVKIQLRNTDESTIKPVLLSVVEELKKAGLENNIVSAEIEDDEPFNG